MRFRGDGCFALIPIIQILLILFLLVGEVRCIVKAVQADWDPIGKAEVIYAGAAITGLGGIVGWFNIEDN